MSEGDSGGIPLWMVTFSDLATLLLTFFVLLLSMSSMDDKTLKSLFTNFTSACGILNFKQYGEIYRPKDVLIEGLYHRLKDTLVIKRSDDPVEIPAESKETFVHEIGSQLLMENDQNGFRLVFGHKLLFSPGSAEIREEMKPVLDKIARFMTVSSYQVYIDGHTDNIPLGGTSKYLSNMELSLQRAFNIMDYLVTVGKISPESIALAGYGEFMPVSSNETPAGRGKNRRVEMIFKNRSYF
jgi:chemotaxis protein MotB